MCVIKQFMSNRSVKGNIILPIRKHYCFVYRNADRTNLKVGVENLCKRRTSYNRLVILVLAQNDCSNYTIANRLVFYIFNLCEEADSYFCWNIVQTSLVLICIFLRIMVQKIKHLFSVLFINFTIH